jgi:hypothetical protein
MSSQYVALFVALAAVCGIALAWPNLAYAPHGCGESGCMTRLTGQTGLTAGSPTGLGDATVMLHEKQSRVCWTLTVQGLDTVTGADVEEVLNGKVKVVVHLFSGRLRPRGCVAATETTVTAIDDNPANYFVNVHTVKHPAGAIRGQL